MRRFKDQDLVGQPMQLTPGNDFAPDGPPLHVAHICIWGFLAELFLAGGCVLFLAGSAVRAMVAGN